MKNKIDKIMSSKIFPIIALCFSIFGTVMTYNSRFVWVFVNTALKMDYFVLSVLCIMILNTFALGLLNIVKLYNLNFKGYKTSMYITTVLTVISTVIGIVFLVMTCSRESAGVSFEYFRDSFFKMCGFIIIPALMIFVPKLKVKSRKIATSIVLVCTMIFAFLSLFPVTPYEITSAPAVIDNGSEYSVVFATTHKGTGYVEYEYNGENYKVYDEIGGRLNCDSKIHSIAIPYEHLKNNTYSVGSVRVIGEYSYGSRLGKEVMSEKYNFKVNETSNQTYLTVSDWHTHLDRAYNAIEYLGKYDGVILMGDATPGVDYENEVVRNIVEFAGTVSGGTKPVFYTRGNHETRGAYAGKLMTALGLNEFYYETQIGDIKFVVLDSGEDKDDSHPEYGGLDNYNEYRAKQIEWLKTVEAETNKVISLSHSWRVSDVEEDLSNIAWEELNRLGVTLMISGHTHECRFIGENDDREKEIFSKYPNITGYMDGGNTSEYYVASKLTINESEILIEAYTNNGEKVFDETVEW